MPTKLTDEIINAAIEGFEAQKRRIDEHIGELRTMLDGVPAKSAAAPEAPQTPGRTRKKFSAAARRKMAKAQKTRWAKIKGQSEPPSSATPEPPKPKRRISPEGMKRIIAATKKRWRLQKAAGKSVPTKKIASKKVAVKKARAKVAAKNTAPAAAQAAV
jgi:hypothetical protein